MDFAEFSQKMLTGDEPVYDVQAEPPGLDRWPMVVVRNGPYTAVLQLQGHLDHLAIDVHPFFDGRDARAGVIGMEDGDRVSLPDIVGGTSHGWPAMRLITVLVGAQTSTPRYGDVEVFAEAAGTVQSWVAVLQGKRIVAGAGSEAEAWKMVGNWLHFFPNRPDDWDDYADDRRGTSSADAGGRLVWGDAGNDHPGDQNASSRHGGHCYWSVGRTGDRWHVELIVRDCMLEEIPGDGLDLGAFGTESEAKEAAQAAEDSPVEDLGLSSAAVCVHAEGGVG